MPKKKTINDFKLTFVLNEEFEQFKTSAKTGQIVQAKVINRTDKNHYLLLLDKQKIIAEFPQNIPVNSDIILKINNIAKRISLQYLGIKEDAGENFRKMFPSSFRLKNEEWESLFAKWMSYKLPLTDDTVPVYNRLYGLIKEIDKKYLTLIPELWLLLRRWKIKPQRENLIKIINIFDVTSENSDSYEALFALSGNDSKFSHNYQNIIYSLLFEKKLPKLSIAEINKLHDLFKSDIFYRLSRDELIAFIVRREGFLFLPFTDDGSVRAVWIKQIVADHSESIYHFMIFALVKGEVVVVDVRSNSTYIYGSFFVSCSRIYATVSEELKVLQNKIAEVSGKTVSIKCLQRSVPEVKFFKYISEDGLQLKRVV